MKVCGDPIEKYSWIKPSNYNSISTQYLSRQCKTLANTISGYYYNTKWAIFARNGAKGAMFWQNGQFLREMGRKGQCFGERGDIWAKWACCLKPMPFDCNFR